MFVFVDLAGGVNHQIGLGNSFERWCARCFQTRRAARAVVHEMLSDSACLDFILEDVFGELTTDILEEQHVKMGIHGWVFSAHFVTDERAACQSHGLCCTRCFQTLWSVER